MVAKQRACAVDVRLVLDEVLRLAEKKVIHFEAPDFEGDVQEFGDVRAGDDLRLRAAQFQIGKQRQPDDQDGDEREANGDLAAQ